MKDAFIPVENDFVVDIAPKQGISLCKFDKFPVKVSMSIQTLPEMVRDETTGRYPSLIYRLDSGDLVRMYTSDLVNAKAKSNNPTSLGEGDSYAIEGSFTIIGTEPLKRNGIVIYPNSCYKGFATFEKETEGVERYSPAYRASRETLIKSGLLPKMEKDHYNVLLVDRPLIAILTSTGERKFPVADISAPIASPRTPRAPRGK